MELSEGTIVEYTIPWISDENRIENKNAGPTRFMGKITGVYTGNVSLKGRYVIPERIYRNEQWYRFIYPESPNAASFDYPHLFTVGNMDSDQCSVGTLDQLKVHSRLPSSFQIYATKWNA